MLKFGKIAASLLCLPSRKIYFDEGRQISAGTTIPASCRRRQEGEASFAFLEDLRSGKFLPYFVPPLPSSSCRRRQEVVERSKAANFQIAWKIYF